MENRRFWQLGLLFWALVGGACRPASDRHLVSGTIETDEVHVGSRYGGRVERIFHSEGDSLTNGEVIVELEATELRAMRALAAAQLQELQAGPRPQEIAAAKSEMDALLAELEFARTEAKRSIELFQENTVSEVDRDRAVSRANALEKRVAAAKSRYELLAAGTRPEQIEQARARLDQIDAQLREMQVLSPTNSVLEVLSVKVGDVVAPNQEVSTLLLPQHLWVRVYVPEPWLGHIHLNDPIQVQTDSFPGQWFDGRVEQISRAAEFTPRNTQTVAERIKQVYGIKVALTNTNDMLRAGMYVDVRFPKIAASEK